MNITKNMLPESKYGLKSPYKMKPTRIVVHNTANDAPAKNEIAYMIRNDSEVSFHYAIDDKEIVQGVPEDRNAWHSGDGANGKGNREGIAIEICYSKSGGTKFDNAEKLAAKFIAEKLKEYSFGIDKVTKHQDYSGKYCPHRTLDKGWQRFLDMISAELNNEQVEPSNDTINELKLLLDTLNEELKVYKNTITAKDSEISKLNKEIGDLKAKLDKVKDIVN